MTSFGVRRGRISLAKELNVAGGPLIASYQTIEYSILLTWQYQT